MKVFKVGLEVKVALAGAVVDDQPSQRRQQCLDPVKGFHEPSALCGVLEIDPPRFIHDRLNDNARVIPVADQNLVEHLLGASGRHHGEVVRGKP